MVLGTNDDWK